jgi:hypothetical protein
VQTVREKDPVLTAVLLLPQPNDDPMGLLVDSTHYPHLPIMLWDVILIDTDNVYPEGPA